MVQFWRDRITIKFPWTKRNMLGSKDNEEGRKDERKGRKAERTTGRRTNM